MVCMKLTRSCLTGGKNADFLSGLRSKHRSSSWHVFLSMLSGRWGFEKGPIPVDVEFNAGSENVLIFKGRKTTPCCGWQTGGGPPKSRGCLVARASGNLPVCTHKLEAEVIRNLTLQRGTITVFPTVVFKSKENEQCF